MTDKFYKWLCSLIASGDVHPFYCSSQWVRLSHKVLDMDKHECQLCKKRGRYRRAELVHHVNHVRRAPKLALDIWYTDADGNRQRNPYQRVQGLPRNSLSPGAAAEMQQPCTADPGALGLIGTPPSRKNGLSGSSPYSRCPLTLPLALRVCVRARMVYRLHKYG